MDRLFGVRFSTAVSAIDTVLAIGAASAARS
jgi:hypothetical protein